jgi:hypothetical protein
MFMTMYSEDIRKYSLVTAIKAECDLSFVRNSRIPEGNLLKLACLFNNLEAFWIKGSFIVNLFRQKWVGESLRDGIVSHQKCHQLTRKENSLLRKQAHKPFDLVD